MDMGDVIAVVALIISILAYQRTGGTAELKRKVESTLPPLTRTWWGQRISIPRILIPEVISQDAIVLKSSDMSTFGWPYVFSPSSP